MFEQFIQNTRLMRDFTNRFQFRNKGGMITRAELDANVSDESAHEKAKTLIKNALEFTVNEKCEDFPSFVEYFKGQLLFYAECEGWTECEDSSGEDEFTIKFNQQDSELLRPVYDAYLESISKNEEQVTQHAAVHAGSGHKGKGKERQSFEQFGYYGSESSDESMGSSIGGAEASGFQSLNTKKHTYVPRSREKGGELKVGMKEFYNAAAIFYRVVQPQYPTTKSPAVPCLTLTERSASAFFMDLYNSSSFSSARSASTPTGVAINQGDMVATFEREYRRLYKEAINDDSYEQTIRITTAFLQEAMQQIFKYCKVSGKSQLEVDYDKIGNDTKDDKKKYHVVSEQARKHLFILKELVSDDDFIPAYLMYLKSDVNQGYFSSSSAIILKAVVEMFNKSHSENVQTIPQLPQAAATRQGTKDGLGELAQTKPASKRKSRRRRRPTNTMASSSNHNSWAISADLPTIKEAKGEGQLSDKIKQEVCMASNSSAETSRPRRVHRLRRRKPVQTSSSWTSTINPRHKRGSTSGAGSAGAGSGAGGGINGTANAVAKDKQALPTRRSAPRPQIIQREPQKPGSTSAVSNGQEQPRQIDYAEVNLRKYIQDSLTLIHQDIASLRVKIDSFESRVLKVETILNGIKTEHTPTSPLQTGVGSPKPLQTGVGSPEPPVSAVEMMGSKEIPKELADAFGGRPPSPITSTDLTAALAPVHESQLGAVPEEKPDVEFNAELFIEILNKNLQSNKYSTEKGFDKSKFDKVAKMLLMTDVLYASDASHDVSASDDMSVIDPDVSSSDDMSVIDPKKCESLIALLDEYHGNLNPSNLNSSMFDAFNVEKLTDEQIAGLVDVHLDERVPKHLQVLAQGSSTSQDESNQDPSNEAATIQCDQVLQHLQLASVEPLTDTVSEQLQELTQGSSTSQDQSSGVSAGLFGTRSDGNDSDRATTTDGQTEAIDGQTESDGNDCDKTSTAEDQADHVLMLAGLK